MKVQEIFLMIPFCKINRFSACNCTTLGFLAMWELNSYGNILIKKILLLFRFEGNQSPESPFIPKTNSK